MKILYFTATGNSLHVANCLSNDLYSIPQLIKSNTYTIEDEKIGLVFPIYSNSVTPYIENFLNKVNIKCSYFFVVMTYGIYDAAAPNHLIDILQKNNIKYNYINTIKMVDNWLPGFNMEKQKQKEYKKNIDDNINKILYDITSNKEFIINTSLIDRMLTNYQVKNKTKENKGLHGNTIGNGIKNYLTVEKGCIKCGTCVKVCPVNNIELIKGNVTLKNNCITCFACTHNCPVNVMRIKSEKDKSRFRNSNITLEEIISSNK